MKIFFYFTFILFCLFLKPPVWAQVQNLHTVRLETASQLHEFFRFKEDAAVIISGHRGGMVAGFPENSIETFENTLKFTPAFYEVDPRLTKDSVIVLMHDATLDRTTTGTGKLGAYEWSEVKKLKLKDKHGNVTSYRVPTLEEAIEWARGKTILNLDIKDVPMEMTARLVKELNAEAFVMFTVHSPEQALFYLERIPESMFSAHIKTVDQFREYEDAGIPWNQVMAYIGPKTKAEDRELYDLLHAKGVRCMISSASSYDKLDTKAERAEAYRNIVLDGASVLESDFPIEVSEAIFPE